MGRMRTEAEPDTCRVLGRPSPRRGGEVERWRGPVAAPAGVLEGGALWPQGCGHSGGDLAPETASPGCREGPGSGQKGEGGGRGLGGRWGGRGALP